MTTEEIALMSVITEIGSKTEYELTSLSFYFDFRSSKFQNFEYEFTVKCKTTGEKKVIKVWSTSEMVAKGQLTGRIGTRFEI